MSTISTECVTSTTPNDSSLSSSMDEICTNLDTLLIRYLELTQEYVDLALKGENYQREGYINLAKSRYIQGPNSLTKANLPSEDSFEEYDAVVKLERDTQDKFVIQDFSKEPEKLGKILKKFGFLSPASVKSSQKCFQNNLTLIVDRANVSLEIKRIQRQIMELTSAKNRLKNLEE